MLFEKKKQLTNDVALTIIKVLSFLAVALLALIIGYLIFRGVHKSERTESDVLPLSTLADAGFESAEPPVIVIANGKSNIRHLSWFTLRDMALGKVASLRKISSTDAPFFLYVEDSALEEASALLGIESRQIAASGAVVASRDEILVQAKDRKGSVLILSRGKEAGPADRPSGFREPVLDLYVLAANSSVVQLYGNNRVGTLSSDDVVGLLSGSVSDWSLLGGGDIPVDVLDAQKLGEQAAVRELSIREGSTAVMPASWYFHAKQEGLSIDLLKSERIDSGPNITWEYLTQPTVESGKYGGILSIIGNTFVMVALTALVAAPLGIAAAVYLVEYARKGRLTSIIRAGIDVLAGIPSIIFGLFGLLVFVQMFGWSFSLISGTLTVALMVLPTIIRTSEEAIRSVDRSLREASIGLGATRIETIVKVILPSAVNGITTGIILAIGRAVGETVALIYTIGSSTDFVKNLGSSARVLSMHIYLTITEGQSFDRAFASALVLVVVVLTINIIARVLMTSSTRRQRGKSND